MTELTEKNTWWIACPTVGKKSPTCMRFSVMSATAEKMMIKYQRTSELFHASLNFRQSRKKYTEKFTPNSIMNTVVTVWI